MYIRHVSESKENEFLRSVCSSSAMKELRNISTFDTKADWPIKQFSEWGLWIFKYTLPHVKFDVQVSDFEREVKSMSLLGIDIAGAYILYKVYCVGEFISGVVQSPLSKKNSPSQSLFGP